MDNFDKNIKQKYNSEDHEKFVENDWKGFSVMRKEKKRKKRRTLFMFLIILPLILFSGFQVFRLSNFQVTEKNAKSADIVKIDQNENAPFAQSNVSIKNTSQSQSTSEKPKLEASELEKSSQAKNDDKVIYKPRNVKTYPTADSKQNSVITLTTNTNNADKADITTQKSKGKLLAEENEIIGHFSEQIGVSTPLPLIPILLEYSSTMTFNPHLVKSEVRNRFFPMGVVLKYSTGLSITPQKEVLDEISTFNDFSLAIRTKSRFRYLLNTHFQEISYRVLEASSVNGISDIVAPRENVMLAQATAETRTIYAGLGLQYLTYRTPLLSHYLGLTYGFETILSKELEYEFEGESEEDDEVVKLTDTDRNLKWNKPKLSTGVEFEYKNIIGFAEISYIHDFNISEATLPRLIHGSIGVGYKF